MEQERTTGQRDPDDQPHAEERSGDTASAQAEAAAGADPGQTTAADSNERAGGTTPPNDAADASAEPLPSSGWAELDAYRDQLRAEHAEWAERLMLLHTQLVSAEPTLQRIAAQYADLGIEDDLAALRQAILGGAGMIQRVHFDFDMERYITLLWPAAADPRPDLAGANAGGEFAVSVWLGISPEGRAIVRVEGEKRLEAPLPTSRTKLRGVLLRAIQAPRRVVPPPAEESPAEEAEAAVAPSAEESPPSEEPMMMPPSGDEPIAMGPGQ